MTAGEFSTRPGRTFTAIAACGVVGAAVAVVGATVAIAQGPAGSPRPAPIATAEYGRRLIVSTSVLLGPDQPDSAMRYAGNRLQCGSCHLHAGTEPGTLTLFDVYGKYPRASGRDGGLRDIKTRINGCMTRSMNGRPLPEDSPEMTAMAIYLRVLGEPDAVARLRRPAVKEPAPFATPDRAANPAAGKHVFDARCAVCHGRDGLGRRKDNTSADGYLFPPLWGPDSFNDGAGMHRVLTAARFIKARMPNGKADLSDDQAFDVAAFINTQARPAMANLDRDYPDRTTKPIDNPYGPFADPFPIEQHRLGPFQPIEAFYAALRRK
jgi:thiosulfate dehydrogenase